MTHLDCHRLRTNKSLYTPSLSTLSIWIFTLPSVLCNKNDDYDNDDDDNDERTYLICIFSPKTDSERNWMREKERTIIFSREREREREREKYSHYFRLEQQVCMKGTQVSERTAHRLNYLSPKKEARGETKERQINEGWKYQKKIAATRWTRAERKRCGQWKFQGRWLACRQVLQ